MVIMLLISHFNLTSEAQNIILYIEPDDRPYPTLIDTK